MDNAAAFAELQAAIDGLRALKQLPEAVAPLAAEALHQEVTKQIARGEGPDGKPWQPTKTGKRPLQQAAGALRATSSGSVALLVLEGPEVLHHEGRAKGGVRRQILPGKVLNAPAVRALQRVAAETFQEVLHGKP